MYNMFDEKLPKPPVITSQAGALNQVTTWLKENRFDRVKDADGMEWTVTVKAHPVPNPKNPKTSLWHIKVLVTAKATARDLLDSGVLCKEKDARLLSLLGDDILPLTMKPVSYEASSEEEARSILANALPRLKSNFNRSALGEVKRSLAGRWVNENGVFGASGS